LTKISFLHWDPHTFLLFWVIQEHFLLLMNTVLLTLK